MSADLNALCLFSGAGGLDLGLERAGIRVVGQVELDPFRRSILARHWPDVPKHDDVTTFAAWWRQEERPHVDIVAGGFPCQPFSIAGNQRGTADERWMWPSMADTIRLVRPRYVVVENVPALLADSVAFGWLLSDMAALGFDAEWSVLSACAVGAPHTRERLLLVAYADKVDGAPRMGAEHDRPKPVLSCADGARAWRDRTDWAVEASGADDRDVDGLAAAMVAAGGDAVVPAVAEYVGRLIAATANSQPMEAAS